MSESPSTYRFDYEINPWSTDQHTIKLAAERHEKIVANHIGKVMFNQAISCRNPVTMRLSKWERNGLPAHAAFPPAASVTQVSYLLEMMEVTQLKVVLPAVGLSSRGGGSPYDEPPPRVTSTTSELFVEVIDRAKRQLAADVESLRHMVGKIGRMLMPLRNWYIAQSAEHGPRTLG